MFWRERAKAALMALGCREAWRLPARSSRALVRSLFATRPVTAPSGTFLDPYSPPLGGESFRRHLRGLRRLARGERVPLAVDLSVTDRCLNRCARCSNLSKDRPDPSLESVEKLLAALRRLGTTRVALTGGEPVLREDLARIVEACGEGMATLLFSSGTRLDADRARELRRAGLRAAFVSLDHFEAGEHDRVRGRVGAFREALEAIAACRKAGLYTAAQAVVEPALLTDGVLERFLDFCRNLGVHQVMLIERAPVRGTAGYFPVDEASRIRLAGLHRRSAVDSRLPKVTSTFFLESPEFLGCQAGFTFLYVSTSGEVFPCDLVPLSFGNVYRIDPEEILARLARCLRAPSRRCLALRLEELAGEEQRPIPWERTATILRGYDPGEAPGLMKWLLPERNAR